MARKKLLLSFVVLSAFLLIVSIAFGVSFAYYTENRSAKGRTIFDKGIYVQISNLTNDGNLYYNNGSGNTVFSGVSCEPNSTFSIVNSSLNVLSSSVAVYARAKLVAKFYVNENEQFVEKTVSQLGATDYDSLMEAIFSSLPTFSASWQEATDGYYYYTQSGKQLSRANLQIINPNSNSGNIFDSTSLSISDYEVIEGAPYGISKIELLLVVDVIQSDGISAWNPLEIGTLDTSLYTLKNAGASEVIDSSISLTENTTYTLIENATGNGYKFTYAVDGGVNKVKVTASYNSPKSLEILSNFKWNGQSYTTTAIADNAFSNNLITSITIPNSVTSIGIGAFSGCSNLTKFTASGTYTTLDNDRLLMKGNEVVGFAPSGLTTYTIPNSVTGIGNATFYGCTGLTSITIGNSVTSIGNSAFYNCSSLTSITIPNSVTSIGSYAFYNCSSLTSITIPNSVTSIGPHTFHSCSSLTNITIPNSATSIGTNAFYGCSSLTSVTIPNSVTSIGYGAFYNCSKLTSVTIPNSVSNMGNSVFENCTGLTSVIIPNSITSIEDNSFSGCSNLTSVYINSDTVSSELTSQTDMGYLINYAESVYIKSGLTVGSYVANTSNFPYVTNNVSFNGETYTRYSKNSSWIFAGFFVKML